MADGSAPTGVQFGEDTLERTKTADSMNIYKRGISVQEADHESVFSDKGDGVRESDYKKRQVFKGWTLLWLAYQSTGVIYGDIGTSPLYVYSSTFTSEPAEADLLGALSLIIWSLTIIVTIKYVLIVLRADDEGEGGTFAIYSLLSRYSDIMKHDPRVNRLVKMQRHGTNELHASNNSIRTWLEKSRVAHGLLKILAVLGVSLIMADGILTPAQSVLGAIQGLEVVKPDISSGTIVGVSCAILVLLFVVQPLGIHRLSHAFAPVVIIWLLFNGCFGIYNLVVHDWRVLKAFSPFFAGDWFVRNKTTGWINLGGILLAFTGVEALFADLGAFSRRAIQLSWLCLTYPCLLLAYTGQAAYISKFPSAYSNPFFQTVPPGMFYPSLVIAILAAVVASQALITSTFQLLSQVMHSSYFPHITTIYTSDKFHGQVYIPMANWLMMIGTVIVTAVYSNTTRLGHAYGVCVILVTFITTNLVTLVAVIVWRVHPAIVFLVWLPFVTLDALFLTSALTKVPNGAWFTLLLAVLLASFFSLWRYGKEKQWTWESKDRHDISEIILKNPDSNGQMLSHRYGGGELQEIDGMGIFFDKAGDFVPAVYEQWLRKFRTQMDVVVLMHMRALSQPHVEEEEKYAVSRTSAKNVYRLTIRHGYNDHVITPDLARLVYEEVRKAIVRGAVKAPPSEESSSTGKSDKQTEADDAALAARLRHLDEAYNTQALYLVGKQKMRINEKYNFVKKMVLGAFLWVRENSRTRIEQLNVPVEKLVEVGFVGEI
ncbi:hypothetical protein LTR36_005336 [Oleoguttula mirabilis]|uniref:Potassium transporter n=1 Tax=Oleoguttula mirabilis TaxID=1507867 RepID=A0AAV9JF04_9PEZI|nr:hypothetical protein LTR36_005336 [Oleoguttula mirabilis]